MLQTKLVRRETQNWWESKETTKNPKIELSEYYSKVEKSIWEKGMEYISPKWERILIYAWHGKLSIFKAEDPKKPITRSKNIKSEYTLSRSFWPKINFKLETNKYENKNGILNNINTKTINSLSIQQTNESLHNFDLRIKEAKISIQQKNEKKFKDMQDLAYKEEKKDQDEAEDILNNSINNDIFTA